MLKNLLDMGSSAYEITDINSLKTNNLYLAVGETHASVGFPCFIFEDDGDYSVTIDSGDEDWTYDWGNTEFYEVKVTL